jgi:ribosome recycling factor
LHCYMQERRKELAKTIGKMSEEGKVAVRNVRKDVMKKYVDKYDFPKDQKRDLETKVQKITDSFVKKLDDMSKTKTDEILKI